MRTVPIAEPVITRLKAWKLRTKGSQQDDLLFPSKRGWYVGHANMVKRKFLPLFDKLARHAKEPDKQPPGPGEGAGPEARSGILCPKGSLPFRLRCSEVAA